MNTIVHTKVWYLVPVETCPTATEFNCPFCDAEPGQMCSEYVDDKGIELSTMIHFGRVLVAEKS